jgi:glycosidase
VKRVLSFVAVSALLVAACTNGDGGATPTTTQPPTPSTTTTVAPTTTTATPETGHWWNDRVFYEVFVRSFQDSDGDGIGDLRGLIDRLDYLNDGDPSTTDDLGVTGLWLMPIMESPSYHGYDVTDYREVDFEYGTNQDFLDLVAAAHERGIAVIIDLVLNHTSKSHPWFGASFLERPEYADWYLWRNEPGPNWHEAGGRYYFALFWEGMPDLDLENPDVTAELYDIADFWLTDMGADGFRLDAVKHYIEDGDVVENTPATLEWAAAFNDHVDATDPATLTVGEIWNGTAVVSSYVPDEVDIAFEFTLAEAIITAAQQGRVGVLPIVLQQVLDAYPPGQWATFLTNHDQDRIASLFVGDAAKAKLAASLLLTNPGVPFIYYGEEVGARGRKPDERIRTPMAWTTEQPGRGFTAGEPWEPFDDNAADATVATQLADPGSLWSHYRGLIRLRNEHEAMRTGAMTLIDTRSDAVLAFTRSAPEERLLVLVNVSTQPQAGFDLGAVVAGDVLLGPGWTPGQPIPPQTTIIAEISD